MIVCGVWMLGVDRSSMVSVWSIEKVMVGDLWLRWVWNLFMLFDGIKRGLSF